MQFKNEYEVQAFIHSVIGGKREVTFQNGKRIDIMNDFCAVEVKPTLTRSAIYQAMGQIIAYRPYVEERRLVIAGMSPKDIRSAESTAREAEQAGIEVWFIDQMQEFQNAWNGVAPQVEETQNDLEVILHWLFGTWTGWASLAFIATYWIGSAAQTRPTPQSVEPTPRQWTTDPQPTGLVPVHAGADPNSAVVFTIPSDATVTPVGCVGDWVRIKEPAGWVALTEFGGEAVCN